MDDDVVAGQRRAWPHAPQIAERVIRNGDAHVAEILRLDLVASKPRQLDGVVDRQLRDPGVHVGVEELVLVGVIDLLHQAAEAGTEDAVEAVLREQNLSVGDPHA